MEKKLLAYIELRTKLHKQDKCGVLFGILRVKVLKWAKEAGISEDNFTASNGWVSGVLKRNGKISINFHGEDDDPTNESAAALMRTWLKEFHKQIDDLSVPRARIYNANQTGLFYTKLLN